MHEGKKDCIQNVWEEYMNHATWSIEYMNMNKLGVCTVNDWHTVLACVLVGAVSLCPNSLDGESNVMINN